jgi:hypothetical protein
MAREEKNFLFIGSRHQGLSLSLSLSVSGGQKHVDVPFSMSLLALGVKNTISI